MFQLDISLPDSDTGYEGELLPDLPTAQLSLVDEHSGEGGFEMTGAAVRDVWSEVAGQLVQVVTEELPRSGPGLDPAWLCHIPRVETVEVQAGNELVRGGGGHDVPRHVPAGAEEGGGACAADHNADVPVYQGARVEVDIKHSAVDHLPVGVLQDRLEGGQHAGDAQSDGPEHLARLGQDLQAAAHGGGQLEPLQEAASGGDAGTVVGGAEAGVTTQVAT